MVRSPNRANSWHSIALCYLCRSRMRTLQLGTVLLQPLHGEQTTPWPLADCTTLKDAMRSDAVRLVISAVCDNGLNKRISPSAKSAYRTLWCPLCRQGSLVDAMSNKWAPVSLSCGPNGWVCVVLSLVAGHQSFSCRWHNHTIL